MGVKSSGATLEIQVIADIARLQKDMSEMKRVVADATGTAGASFQRSGAQSAAAASQMAAAAQVAARAAMGNAGAITGMGKSSAIASHHLTNLTFQINDVVSSLAMGQEPWRVATQQSGQFFQIMQQTGLGFKGLAVEIARVTGLIVVHTNAEKAAALATVQAQAAAIRAITERSAANIASRQTQIALAQAELAAAKTAEAETLATANLVKALRGLEVESGRATIAQQALATAEAEVATAQAAADATTTVRLGKMAGRIGVVGIALGLLIGTFKLFQATLEDQQPVDEFIKGLGLTEDQVKKLGDTTVTVGDMFSGLWRVIMERTGVDESIRDFSAFWVADFAKSVKSIGQIIAELYGAIVGTYRAITKVWDALPAMFGATFARAVNAATEKIESFINRVIAGLNWFTRQANSMLGEDLFSVIGNVSLGRVEADFSQSFGNISGIIRSEISSATAEANGAIKSFVDDVGRYALEARNARLKAKADDILGDQADKAAAKTKKHKEEVDKLKKALEELLLVGLKVDELKTDPLMQDKLDLGEILTPLVDFGDEILENLRLISEQAAITGQALSDAFGPVGDVFATLIGSMANYTEAEEKLRQEVLMRTKTQGQADKELASMRTRNNMAMLSGLKSLFKEHSTGYKVMQTIERAYAAFQLAQTIAAIARDIGLTTSSVANSTTRAAADQAAGAAKIFSQLGAFAFPVVAAMVAVLAAFGLRGKGGGGGSPAPASSADLQGAAGTGTVLGDPAAKSDSIARSLELMAKNSTKGVDHSFAMVSSLRKIEQGIGNLAAALARALNLKGGFFDPDAMGLGSNSSGGLFGIGGLFSSKTTKSLYDQGIILNPATVEQIIMNGITGATYNVIETVKKKSGFLGIGGSTKTSYDTITGPLDADMTNQVQLIIGNIYDAVVDAAAVFGLDVAETLKQFSINIGQLSFKDMTGEEIADQLEAVFSSIADQMAGFAVSGLEQFQMAGEGLFETLMRLAKNYLTIDAALSSIGMTFGSVGASSITMRESLIALMGGLDAFVDQVNFFYDNFLSDAQKLAFQQQQVAASFAAMGIAAPATVEEFAALVTSLNLSTDAGQELFAALMAIAPAFYEVATAAEQLAKKQQELQVQLLQAQGLTEEALALQREIALAAADPALHALMLAVWAAQDAATAEAAALQLANKEKQMTIELLKLQGKAEEALRLEREMALAALDPALHALQLQIWAAEDAAKAAAEAERQRAEAERILAAAKDDLLQAYRRESAELEETAARFRGFAQDLRNFRDSIFSPTDDAMGYRQAMFRMMEQSGLARGGDENALGGGLQDSVTTYLELARSNSSTLQEFNRAKAMAARSIDAGIAGAIGKATIAEQQLAELKDQVGKLIDINESVLTVAQAIERLTDLMFPPAAPAAPVRQRRNRPDGLEDLPDGSLSDPKVINYLDRLSKLTEQSLVANNKVARILTNADKGGALTIVADADAPIPTTGGGLELE